MNDYWRSRSCTSNTSGWVGVDGEVMWATPGARTLAQATQVGWTRRARLVERIQMMDETR